MEQVKILFAEAEENNLDEKVQAERFARWYECSMCKQQYHGVVAHALGWACWKTYLSRPGVDWPLLSAMRNLGNGLSHAEHYEDALSVQEAELSMLRRLGAPENNILGTQNNLGSSYNRIGRLEQAANAFRDVYSGYLKLYGEEHERSITAANNYANSLLNLARKPFEEAKSVLRKMTPVARRVLGEEHRLTLKLRSLYGWALYNDTGATLDDLREAVTTLEDVKRIARRVLGGAHPTTESIADELQDARAALRARETPSP